MNDDALGDFESAVHHIATQGESLLQVIALAPDAFVAVWQGSSRRKDTDVVVFRNSHRILEQLTTVASTRERPVDIIVVAGDERIVRGLRELPVKRGPSFGWTVLHDDGTITSHTPGPAGSSLEDAARDGRAQAVGREEWTAFLERARAVHAEATRKRSEVISFQRTLRAKKPVATWCLLGTIALVFAIQLALGTEATPILVRLGALVPERAFAEPYRLLSCTLLHGGFAHVAMNGYVFYILGSFFERIAGPARLVLLYVFSAIAGSITSTLLSDGTLSVGASGAVWGLLGAHAVLAFVRHDRLPEALVGPARRSAAINLGINILASFHPMIDMWAHFGGGAAGAALFGLVLHRGLPYPGEASETPSRARRGMALISYGALVGGFIAAIAIHQPWRLLGSPELRRREIPELGVSLRLPEVNGRFDDVFVLGDLLEDGTAVLVARLPIFDGTTDGLPHVCPSMDEQGGEVFGVERDDIDHEPALRCRYRFRNGLEQETFFRHVNGLVQVDVVRWPELATADVSNDIAASLRALD